MAGALKNDLSDTEYEISVSGSKVNIKTTEIGSAAKAATVSSSGDKVSQIEFTLDPKKMQAQLLQSTARHTNLSQRATM